MPHEISDAISRYLKQTVSTTSDSSGSYPDEQLIKESQKVWSYLNGFDGVSELSNQVCLWLNQSTDGFEEDNEMIDCYVIPES